VGGEENEVDENEFGKSRGWGCLFPHRTGVQEGPAYSVAGKRFRTSRRGNNTEKNGYTDLNISEGKIQNGTVS